MYGPDNLNKPLSRASQMAERVHQQTPSSTNYQQRRYFSYYYYQFPKIPRPKRNMLYYSTWSRNPVTNASNANKPSKRHMLPLAVSRFRKDCLPMPIKN